MSRVSDRSRIPPRLWRVALILLWTLAGIVLTLGLCKLIETVWP